MTESRLRVVVLGLSLSSSWGNGHATTFRALLKAFAARGHDVDEAKQGGAQLGVLGGEVHRAVVEHAQRAPAPRRQRRVDRAPDGQDVVVAARALAACSHGQRR